MNVSLIARLITMTMFGAICFVLLVPLALQRRQIPFAIAVVALSSHTSSLTRSRGAATSAR